MTDNLRDRIMAALAPHRYGSASTSAKAVDYARADAVIAELGLKRESPQLCPGGANNYRYVTEWQPSKPYCIRCGRPHQQGECKR